MTPKQLLWQCRKYSSYYWILTLGNGGQINSGTGSSGQGGSITINASGPIPLSGTLSDGSPVGIFSRSLGADPDSRSGGNIELHAAQFEVTNGAQVSASTSGAGNAGNIILQGPFSPTQSLYINGAGSGIFTDTHVINITTNLLLPDSASVISASSQFGQQGTIFIQSPISPASGKILPLGQKPLIPATLLSQRCAALAGGSASSFTVVGRDSLPAEPGGWVPSPLALASAEVGGGTLTEPDTRSSLSEPVGETPILSLRRPAGFPDPEFCYKLIDGLCVITITG